MLSNIYRHPRAGTIGRFIEAVANSLFLATVRRAVVSRLPFATLESDVTNVVYLTWLVPVAAGRRFVPHGLDIWQKNGLTPFTILTYKHAHFGPKFLGPMRKLCPSPLQSNWRFYLDHAPPGAPRVSTVLFLKNIMDNLVYALGSRLFSDALPTHLADQFVHLQEGSVFATSISGGRGSAPSLACSVQTVCDKSLSPSFESTFGTWDKAVRFLACQDAAVTPLQAENRLTFAEIDLPVDVSEVLPAMLTDSQAACPLLEALQAEGAPLCFVVPAVRFRVLSERLL